MVKNVDSSVKLLMYPRFVQVFLDKQVGDMSTHDEVFFIPSHTKKLKKKWVKVQLCQLIPITHASFNHQYDNLKRNNLGENREKTLILTVNTLGSGEDRLKLKELMNFCTKLFDRVLDLKTTKTAQAKEIASLKKRVKKLERKRKSKTIGMKRLFKIGRSAQVVSSKYEGLGDQEDASKQGRKIANINADAEVTLIDETQGRNDDNLMFDTGVLDEQEVEVEKVVSTAEVTTESATTTTVNEITLAQTLIEIKAAKSKDKGKEKMIESEEPLKMIPKDQVLFDEQEAIRLQAQFDEEERIAREKEKANTALISQWNDIQDKVETDYELAQRLQVEEQEELIIKENVQELFKNAMKRVNTFVDMDTELVEGGKIREEESSSKRAEEDVAINAIPLATKPAPIVNFQIHRKGRNGYYEIIRANGSAKTYLLFSQLLKEFDKEDVENLRKLVKAKHGNTRPEEGYERVL
ncbi:hypothetical protein Tco_1280289 [Tanacetum coccineum]